MSAKFCCRSGVWIALFVLVLLAGAAPVMADPPGRVARLSHVSGAVSFLPAGESQWGDAMVNRPLVAGDQLYTYREARAELDIGAATLRLNDLSGFSLANLDDSTVQIELTQGTLSLQVHKLYGGQTYEVDTPTLAFVVSQPGEYRIDIGSRDEATRVTVFTGNGMVYGDGDASMRVAERQSYRFIDASLRGDGIRDMPQADAFDGWCSARADRYRNSVTRRYVSDEVIGYSDLDEYGSWDNESSYGPIWYPTRVAVGWAPYRSGRWVWIDPWGWNWIDDAPWGFAPFHYGRWAQVHNRWGWIPGQMTRRPVYAPALVLFIGGHNWGIGITDGGGPVGWAPLGPRDVYMPPYRVSRGYFSNVNVSNIRNKTVINNTNITNIYNNYAAGRPAGKGNDTYRHNPEAVTAVSRETFAHARPVEAGRVHLSREHLRRAEIVNTVAVAPTAASLVPEKARHGHGEGPPPEATSRRVVAHTAPPPKPALFAERVKVREHGGGRPQAQDAAVKAPQHREPALVEPRPERVSPAVMPEPSPNQGGERASRPSSRLRRAPDRQVEPPAKADSPAPSPAEPRPERVSPAVMPEPSPNQGGDRASRPSSRLRRAPDRQVEPPAKAERSVPPPPAREERQNAPPAAPRQVEGRAPQSDNAAAPPDKRKKHEHEKDCTGKDANDKECIDRNVGVK